MVCLILYVRGSEVAVKTTELTHLRSADLTVNIQILNIFHELLLKKRTFQKSIYMKLSVNCLAPVPNLVRRQGEKGISSGELEKKDQTWGLRGNQHCCDIFH